MAIPITHGAKDEDAAKPTSAPFPVRSRNAAAVVDGVRTEISCLMFADKILVTIAQEGRLAHWVHVPLHSTSPAQSDGRLHLSSALNAEDDEGGLEGAELLPMSNLTATTILGASGTECDTLSQLFATQLASAIVAKTPDEERLLVLGLGLKNGEMPRDAFLKVLEGALRVLGI